MAASLTRPVATRQVLTAGLHACACGMYCLPDQVAGRLKVLWKDWRKLPHEQQKAWGDKQLGERCLELLTAVAGAACG